MNKLIQIVKKCLNKFNNDNNDNDFKNFCNQYNDKNDLRIQNRLFKITQDINNYETFMNNFITMTDEIYLIKILFDYYTIDICRCNYRDIENVSIYVQNNHPNTNYKYHWSRRNKD